MAGFRTWRRWCGVASGMALATLTLRAQDKTPDFSAGFASLYRLGLPETKGATYVLLKGDLPAHSALGHGSEDRRRLRLTCNAWMIKEDKAGPSQFIVAQRVPAEMWDSAAWLARQRAAARETGDQTGDGQAGPAQPPVPHPAPFLSPLFSRGGLGGDGEAR